VRRTRSLLCLRNFSSCSDKPSRFFCYFIGQDSSQMLSWRPPSSVMLPPFWPFLYFLISTNIAHLSAKCFATGYRGQCISLKAIWATVETYSPTTLATHAKPRSESENDNNIHRRLDYLQPEHWSKTWVVRTAARPAVCASSCRCVGLQDKFDDRTK